MQLVAPLYAKHPKHNQHFHQILSTKKPKILRSLGDYLESWRQKTQNANSTVFEPDTMRQDYYCMVVQKKKAEKTWLWLVSCMKALLYRGYTYIYVRTCTPNQVSATGISRVSSHFLYRVGSILVWALKPTLGFPHTIHTHTEAHSLVCL